MSAATERPPAGGRDRPSPHPRFGPRPGLGRARALARIPRAAWICGLIACLNAVCWSFVTPAFQVPDEPDHYAYVKQLVDTGRLPSSNTELTSREIVDALVGLRYPEVREQPENRAIHSQGEEDELRHDLALGAEEPGTGSPAAGVAASQPPLYYALEAVPYGLAGGTVLDRLALMRVASALFAGLTAMFAFLFVRETLPGTRWAWIVGGLAVALTPLLGFMSGAVNPDALLFAVSAAGFYCLARAFRRGLEMGGALALGGVLAVGFLTKLNFIGLAPGMLLGLVVLARRAARVRGRRAAYRMLAGSLAIAASPVVVYVASNLLAGHHALGIVSSALHLTHGSLLAQLDYTWQLYLPRLPGTVDYFPGLLTTQQLWFRGYVGLYGWLDTPFPSWVNHLALIPAGALALLCGRSLLACRPALRARAAELAVYALMAIGLLALVGADSYLSFPRVSAEYAQVRYLLPLLPLFGAAVAIAARGAGRRFGPAVGALIVVLFLAHDVFSQLLVVGRYYG
jgi:4-amino-4-deoxy-L-arabinose transferase-like glycosyltransferase